MIKALLVLLAAVGLCVPILYLGPDAAHWLLPRLPASWADSAPAVETVFTAIIYGALLLVALLGGALVRINPLRPGNRPLAMSGLGVLVGLIGLGAAILYAWLAGSLATVPAPTLDPTLLLWGVALFFFQSASEEIYFRGWLQPVLAERWGVLAGVGIAALAFAGLHVIGGARSPTTVANLLLGGLLFGLLAARGAGIAAAVMAHFAWNWAESVGFGLLPNPGVGSFGAIRDLELVGAPLWGGGPEGLNASLTMTFALAVLILPFLFLELRRPAPARAAARARAAAIITPPPPLAATPERNVAKADEPLRISSGGKSHVGKVRELNEDSLLCAEEDGIWVVADGMGGHEHGEWAAAIVTRELQAIDASAPLDTMLKDATLRIRRANQIIFEESRSRGARMGSTVVALLAKQRRFSILWVGDSRAYLLRAGKLHQLSTDHSHVEELIEKGLLGPDEAKRHPMAHVLTRAVGATDTVVVDAVEDALEPGDSILLCSDGLHGCVERDDIGRVLGRAEPEKVAEDLISLALENGGPDNVTVIVVQFGDRSDHEPSESLAA